MGIPDKLEGMLSQLMTRGSLARANSNGSFQKPLRRRQTVSSPNFRDATGLSPNCSPDVRTQSVGFAPAARAEREELRQAVLVEADTRAETIGAPPGGAPGSPEISKSSPFDA